MGLFGTSRKKNPFDLSGGWNQFDPSNPDYTPPGGTYAQQPQQAPQRESWMDGGKATGRDFLALALSSIGDTLAQRSGGQAWAMPMLMKGRADARDERRAGEAAAAKRQLDNQDWQAHYDYEVAHPKTESQPPAFVKNVEAWNQMTPEQKRQVAQMQSVLNPGFAAGVDGQRYQNPPAQVPGPAPWHTNPDDWEMIPGPGGGAGNGVGGFPGGNIPSGNPLDPFHRRR